MKDLALSILHVAIALVLAPLLPGVINRTKAFFAGRTGQPFFQLYYDLSKLFRRGAVYSRTTTWVFRAGPLAGLAAALGALAVSPMGESRALLAFPGDLVLLAYWLGVMRFFTVLAALDTGSAFEGMGASREVQFSALAEPALLLGLAALVGQTHCLSLSDIFNKITPASFLTAGPALFLVAGAILVVFLAENARVPVDDPNTHLELTMIHEVMILDHTGVDLGMMLYGASLKMWVLGSLLMGVLLPVRTGWCVLDLAIDIAGMFVLAVVTGVIESTVARLRLPRVPQLLVAATVMSALALLLVMRNS